jgi:hypothetical protein
MTTTCPPPGTKELADFNERLAQHRVSQQRRVSAAKMLLPKQLPPIPLSTMWERWLEFMKGPQA